MPEITEAHFETLPPDAPPGWRVRVSVTGSGFEARAVPIIAAVGDQTLDTIVRMSDASGFVGFLPELPPIGAKLLVGYLDEELTDTGITYQPAIA